MFEKDANDSFNCKKVLYKWETDKRSYIDGFKDGAEFGYNKAKWHYVKYGDLPKDDKQYLVFTRNALSASYKRAIRPCHTSHRGDTSTRRNIYIHKRLHKS